MSTAIRQLNEIIEAEFLDAEKRTDLKIADVVDSLKSDQQWYARGLVVQHLLNPQEEMTANRAPLVQKIYSELVASQKNDAMLRLEAARAAAAFEQPDVLLEHLTAAGELLKMQPEVTGTEVQFFEDQNPPAKQLVCLLDPVSEQTSEQNELPNVPLHGERGRLPTPKLVNAELSDRARGEVSTVAAELLLLHCAHTEQTNPLAKVVSEQALPYVRRITDSASFSKLETLVAQCALVKRSELEQKDAAELERGCVELQKLSLQAMKSGKLPQAKLKTALENFHLVIAPTLNQIFESAARRLVALSDFANAAPLYHQLNRPLDEAVCLAATGNNAEAEKLLSQPEFSKNEKALLLRGDFFGDERALKSAWEQFRTPKAKLRLAQRAMARKDAESALQHAEELLAVSPQDYDGLGVAAECALRLEQWPKGVKYLRKRLQADPNDARGWSGLATALIHNGDPAGAHSALQQSLRADQNEVADPAALSNFCALSAQLSKWDDVVQAFCTLAGSKSEPAAMYAVRLAPLLPKIPLNASRERQLRASLAGMQGGKLEECAKLLQELLDKNPQAGQK